jgi:type II secretory pathway predicted ATPase ExeA
MYEEYFGLDRPPFKISPDTSLFFEGGKRGDILAALVYAVHRGEGIVKVVGEVGSGKTMLCRMLQLKLPGSVEIVYIGNPSVSAEDILFVIAHELELHVSKDASKHEVMHMLHDYLLQRHIEDKQVVLFIEEAQGMPLETLEEIRLLSNLETDQHKLLQIILFGQPELDANLSNESIRQLRERITHNFDLSPFTASEIHDYLNFRMREVGYTGPEIITQKLAKKVAHYSNGLLRRINIIADKILLSAFSESTHSLTSRHVIAAVNDSEFSREAPNKTRLAWWLLAITLVALAFAIYQTESLWVGALAQFRAETPILQQNPPPRTELPTHTNPDKKAVIDNDSKPVEPDQQLVKIETSQAEVSEVLKENSVTLDSEPVVEQEPVKAGTTATDALLVSSEPTTIDEPVTLEKSIGADQQVIALVAQSDDIASDQSEPEKVAADTENKATQLPELRTTTSMDQAIGDDESIQVSSGPGLSPDQWLSLKLQQSREWLSHVDRGKVSIQVLMRRKSAAHELVSYLRNQWPLNLDVTYLYEYNIEAQVIYRVFYSEFDSVAHGLREIENLPDSVKTNSPYLHSVYRMQKVFL